MKRRSSFFAGLALCALLVGCRTPPVQPQWQRVTVKPKPNQRVTIGQKINPIWWLGNIDAPKPPEQYRVGEKCREYRWRLRNPGHNFTFYVIGIADKESERIGRYPTKVFNPNGGWNVAFSRRKIFWLPFVSYQRGGFKFYLGWRDSGNFGFKLNF